VKPKLHDDVFIAGVDRHGMAEPTIVEDLNASPTAGFPPIFNIKGQDRRQLFH